MARSLAVLAGSWAQLRSTFAATHALGPTALAALCLRAPQATCGSATAAWLHCTPEAHVPRARQQRQDTDFPRIPADVLARAAQTQRADRAPRARAVAPDSRAAPSAARRSPSAPYRSARADAQGREPRVPAQGAASRGGAGGAGRGVGRQQARPPSPRRPDRGPLVAAQGAAPRGAAGGALQSAGRQQARATSPPRPGREPLVAAQGAAPRGGTGGAWQGAGRQQVRATSPPRPDSKTAGSRPASHERSTPRQQGGRDSDQSLSSQGRAERPPQQPLWSSSPARASKRDAQPPRHTPPRDERRGGAGNSKLRGFVAADRNERVHSHLYDLYADPADAPARRRRDWDGMQGAAATRTRTAGDAAWSGRQRHDVRAVATEKKDAAQPRSSGARDASSSASSGASEVVSRAVRGMQGPAPNAAPVDSSESTPIDPASIAPRADKDEGPGLNAARLDTSGSSWSADRGYMLRNADKYFLGLPLQRLRDARASAAAQKEIDAAATTAALLSAIPKSIGVLTPNALAAIVYRAGRLSAAGAPSEAVVRTAGNALERLLPQVRELTPRGAVAALHGLANLQRKTRCPRAQVLLHQLAASGLGGASGHTEAWTCVNFLWASAKLDQSPAPALLDRAVKSLTAHAAGSHSLSSALWALAKMQYYPGRDALAKLITATVKAEPIDHWDRPQRVANAVWGLKELRHPVSMPIRIAIAKHLSVNWQQYPPAAAVSSVHSLADERMALPQSSVQALQRRANEEALKLDRRSAQILDAAFSRMQAHAVADLPSAGEQGGGAGDEKRPKQAAAAG